MTVNDESKQSTKKIRLWHQLTDLVTETALFEDLIAEYYISEHYIYWHNGQKSVWLFSGFQEQKGYHFLVSFGFYPPVTPLLPLCGF